MRRHRRRFVAYCMMVTFIFLTGCAGILNPYDSEFNCPETNKGKCRGVRDAYDESLIGLDEYGEACSDGDCDEKKSTQDRLIEKKSHKFTSKPERLYYDSVYREMAGLIREPSTPVALPPRIIRALIFPYTSDRDKSNVLYMPRYIYFFVEDRPKWIVGDYLIEGEQ
jgi:conjugal transfer pilus assembly protein TraV